MIDFLLSSFLVYQYWLLFFVMYFASFGFPLPATALLVAGWAFYAQGYFPLSSLFIAGSLGCILWDNTGYFLSYHYWKWIFQRLWLSKILNSRQFTSFEPIFIKRSIFSVFITRFLITGLGPSVNILAWITKMKPSHFIISDIIGEMIYITLGIGIGYSFSSQWESILQIIESFSSMLLTFTLLLLIAYFLWKHRHRGVHSSL